MPVYYPLVGSILLPSLGVIPVLFTNQDTKDWFERLKKPKNVKYMKWIAAPIWTWLSYSLGYSSYLVYMEGGGFNGPARLPLIAYGTQLALHWSWSPVFYGMRNLKLGFFNMIALDTAVVTCGVLFYQINKTAGLLLAPYAAWLGVVTVITYIIYRDNPDPDKIKEI